MTYFYKIKILVRLIIYKDALSLFRIIFVQNEYYCSEKNSKVHLFLRILYEPKKSVSAYFSIKLNYNNKLL